MEYTTLFKCFNRANQASCPPYLCFTLPNQAALDYVAADLMKLNNHVPPLTADELINLKPK